MRGADSVAAHILQRLDLTDKGTLVDRCAQGTEVVVQTNTLQFSCDTIQLETAFLGALDRADTELLTGLVEQLSVLHIFDVGCIEIGRFGCP